MKGKIGGSTQMRNAADAGCTFTFTKHERNRYGVLQRHLREAKKISEELAAKFNPTPRLVKKG